MDQVDSSTGCDVKLCAGLTDEDVELPPESGADDVTQLIRLSLSRNEAGDIEVYSCQSGTTLVLPVRDVDLLIAGIRSFLNDETERETISLQIDQLSQACASAGLEKLAVKRSQINKLFFSCVIYETEEIERMLALPVLPRYIRIAYVRLFDWLSPAIRDRLGFR